MSLIMHLPLNKEPTIYDEKIDLGEGGEQFLYQNLKYEFPRVPKELKDQITLLIDAYDVDTLVEFRINGHLLTNSGNNLATGDNQRSLIQKEIPVEYINCEDRNIVNVFNIGGDSGFIYSVRLVSMESMTSNAVLPLRMGVGAYLDADVNEGNPKFYFKDGRVLETNIVQESVNNTSEEIVYLTVDDFSSPTLEIKLVWMYNDFMGQVTDLPELRGGLIIEECDLTGTISEFPDLNKLVLKNVSTVTGNLIDIPAAIDYYELYQMENIVIDSSNLPQASTIKIEQCDSVSGAITNLPTGINTLELDSLYNASFDLGELYEGIERFKLRYLSTVSGTLSQLPSTLNSLEIYTNSGITGDVSDILATITDSIVIFSSAEIAGNLSTFSSVQNFVQMYSNNLVGDASDFTSLTGSLWIAHCDNITIDLATLPRVTKELVISDQLSVVGNVADLPSPSDKLVIKDTNDITGSLSALDTLDCTYIEFEYCSGLTGPFSPHPNVEDIRLKGTGMTPTEVDDMIAHLNATTNVNDPSRPNYGRLVLYGQDRTTASDADVQGLRDKGWTVMAYDVV